MDPPKSAEAAYNSSLRREKEDLVLVLGRTIDFLPTSKERAEVVRVLEAVAEDDDIEHARLAAVLCLKEREDTKQ